MSEMAGEDRRDTEIEMTGKELEEAKNKKMLAGILGIILGGLGIHKFVLGYTTPGVIMLLVSVLSCSIAYPIMHVIGLVEGILYLTKSDREFYETYMVNKKEWF
jgi:TM2 domain-containing membrane protein YozV